MVKKIPEFKNEDEERDFWDRDDALDYFDMDHPVQFDLSGLKASTESISLRLPQSLLSSLKKLANERDVPYQSLIKMILAERMQLEEARKMMINDRPKKPYGAKRWARAVGNSV